MSTCVEMKNITKVYKKGALDVVALKNVTLTIEKGKFISIMGPRGVGKPLCLTLLDVLIRQHLEILFTMEHLCTIWMRMNSPTIARKTLVLFFNRTI